MIHTLRPAVMDAIRGSMNRRGALAALLAALTLAPLGDEHAAAMRNHRHGKRGAKSEGKKKKKAKAGPVGPAGPQGPAGSRGPAGSKAITSTLSVHNVDCNVPPSDTLTCTAPCKPGELAISGGFIALAPNLLVYESRKAEETWVVSARNTHTAARSAVGVYVYCLPV